MPEPRRRYSPKLQEVSLDVSELKYSCATWEVPRSNRSGGIIRFVGVYEPGSAGTLDALFIDWRIREFCELAAFRGLIIDFTDLDYVWGDDFAVPFEPLGNGPVLVVVAPERLDDFRELGPVELRTDLEETFAEMCDLIRALKN
jgi:hypothetical protein